MIRTPEHLTDEQREKLVDALAARIRDDVRISPGPNAVAALARGERIILSGREAEYAARAALAAIDDHASLEVRPDHPTQWACDAACRALESHRQRADRLQKRVEELEDLQAQVPSGCRHCGIPEREHYQQHAEGAGWHSWEAPTTEQIKLRMFARRTAAAEARAARLEAEGVDRMADRFMEQTRIRSMEIRGGMSLDLEPAREMAALWVGAARGMLGDAPNYTETLMELPTDDDPKVTMEVKLAGELERYAFVLQRVGTLTPHQARQAAEDERDAALELLRDAAAALADLGACDDPDCETEPCSHVLTRIRAAVGDPTHEPTSMKK